MSPKRKNYMPLAINMAGLRCLVLGGGRVGQRKVATLLDAGAEVTLVAPKISAALGKLADAGRVDWQKRRYDVEMLDRCALVVAATDDPALNLRICREAHARGILSCNVSAGNRSRVIFPAVYADGQVTVAVHSQGRDCRLSQKVRNEIAAWRASREGGKPGED
jgi:precorrin-2 dehydrogenase/sirohydrochlorin ferrochelatase